MKALLLTTLALVAFAANSVLARMALAGGGIDAAGFTIVRLLAGAITLATLVAALNRGRPALRANWLSAFWLFVYAAAFSAAYLSLGAGTGALILFGTVQITMLLAALRAGERPLPGEWWGLALALGGLVYLLLPGLTAPAPLGAALMALAGLAWAFYSLRGRAAQQPLADTAANFLYSLPFAAALALLAWGRFGASLEGIVLACASGALASGLGYFIWYSALRGLTATRAALVQLAVPVLAAFGGVLLLDEAITPRLAIAAVLVLGGVGLAVAARRTPVQTAPAAGGQRPPE